MKKRDEKWKSIIFEKSSVWSLYFQLMTERLMSSVLVAVPTTQQKPEISNDPTKTISKPKVIKKTKKL